MPKYVKLTKGKKTIEVVDTSVRVWKERGWTEGEAKEEQKSDAPTPPAPKKQTDPS